MTEHCSRRTSPRRDVTGRETASDNAEPDYRIRLDLKPRFRDVGGRTCQRVRLAPGPRHRASRGWRDAQEHDPLGSVACGPVPRPHRRASAPWARRRAARRPHGQALLADASEGMCTDEGARAWEMLRLFPVPPLREVKVGQSARGDSPDRNLRAMKYSCSWVVRIKTRPMRGSARMCLWCPRHWLRHGPDVVSSRREPFSTVIGGFGAAEDAQQVYRRVVGCGTLSLGSSANRTACLCQD